MPALPFLDTNLLIRHITQDHPEYAARATALIRRIEAGTLRVRTSETVIFETVFTLQSFYQLTRPEIASVLLQLLKLSGIRLIGKQRFRRAFDLYLSFPRLSFADCYHVAFMESHGLSTMISFDRGLDRIATITRVEPDAAGMI